MKNAFLFTIAIMISLFTLISSCNKQVKTGIDQRTSSFDEGWRFVKDNPSGAEDPSFDDCSIEIATE